MVSPTQALQTREMAASSAWVIFQRNVRRLSIAAICTLAQQEPIRREDGRYDPDGGLGRPVAQSTVYRWLADARDQFRDEYIKRPILDMVMEEDERLEHLAAEWAHEAARLPLGTPGRHNALDRYLRVLESRRKLLGIDRPIQVEVTDDRAAHTDPASVALQAALQQAEQRRAELYADLRNEAG